MRKKPASIPCRIRPEFGAFHGDFQAQAYMGSSDRIHVPVSSCATTKEKAGIPLTPPPDRCIFHAGSKGSTETEK